MTTISTLTPTQYRELYGKQAVLSEQSTMVDTAVSIMSQNNTSSTSSSSSDGADDGKISFWSGVKSFFKGIGKTVVNAVKSLNPLNPKNWWNIIKTVAIGVACFYCPALGVALACVAGAKGVVTVGKGIKAAHNATTDAEAEAAWENIGSGSFQVGMAAVAARCGIKAINAQGGLIRSLQHTGTALKNFGTSARSGLGNVRKTFKTEGLGAVKTYGSKAYNGIKNHANDIHNKYTGLKDANGGSGLKAAGEMWHETGAYKLYDNYKGARAGNNSIFKSTGSALKSTKTYSTLTNAATKIGYRKPTSAPLFSASSSTVANLLEAANSDDEMAQKEAVAKLQQLGYYNIYKS